MLSKFVDTTQFLRGEWRCSLVEFNKIGAVQQACPAKLRINYGTEFYNMVRKATGTFCMFCSMKQRKHIDLQLLKCENSQTTLLFDIIL